MLEEPREPPGNKTTYLRTVNWFGLAAGAMMLVLPFMGAWWYAEVGDSAMRLELSPFHYSVEILEQPLTSSLVGYFLLGVKLSVLIGGLLLSVGSLATNRWWGEKLMRFGATKVLWMVVSFIITLVLGALLLNHVLPAFMSGMLRGGEMSLNVPYVVGASASTVQVENATLSAPLTLSFTETFWIAVFTAILGLSLIHI